jgi:hypothetical protein
VSRALGEVRPELCVVSEPPPASLPLIENLFGLCHFVRMFDVLFPRELDILGPHFH